MQCMSESFASRSCMLTQFSWQLGVADTYCFRLKWRRQEYLGKLRTSLVGESGKDGNLDGCTSKYLVGLSVRILINESTLLSHWRSFSMMDPPHHQSQDHPDLPSRVSTESLLSHDESDFQHTKEVPPYSWLGFILPVRNSGARRWHRLPAIFRESHMKSSPFLRKGERKTRSRLVWLFCIVTITVICILAALKVSRILSPHTDLNHDGLPDADRVASYVTHEQASSEWSPSSATSTSKSISLDEILGGTFKTQHRQLGWFADEEPLGDLTLVETSFRPEEDDYYIRSMRMSSRQLHEKSSFSENPTVLMKQPAISFNGRSIPVDDSWVSPDLKMILVATNTTKIWRHSFIGLYWLIDVETQSVQPLDPDFPASPIQLAIWSPSSNAVAFVREGNIYLRSRELVSPSVMTLTNDAHLDEVFYGVPDWAYEEEVFEGRQALWWSPDGRFIAFLMTNDSLVSGHTLQYVAPAGDKETMDHAFQPYQREKTYKYPKPGTQNPIVQLLIHDTHGISTWPVEIDEGTINDSNRIIFHVVWVSETRVLVKQTNRGSDILEVILVDTTKKSSALVRSESPSSLDGGWVEALQSIKPVPADPRRGRLQDGYIDTVIHEGFNHLAYFTPLTSSSPSVLLTRGQWQVANTPPAVDLESNTVYFVAARPSPGARNIYKVSLNGSDLEPITKDSEPAYYDVEFSPSARYAILNYEGPELPWQSIVSLSPQTEMIEHEQKIEDNQRLLKEVQGHSLPKNIYHTLRIGGEILPLIERLPPNFDPDKRYPAVFYVYGGPGSQQVTYKHRVDFQSYLASRGYVVVTLDGRGTGYNGRRVQVAVRDRIGQLESMDQIEAAREWKYNKSYIDPDRMAVWGWSFGGFLSLKTMEVDGGATFKYGMAVAPVTDWRYYGRMLRLPLLEQESSAILTIRIL